MADLYKELFVEFYIDTENDRICQDCVKGTAMYWKRVSVKSLTEVLERLPVASRFWVERIKDNWKDLM